MESMSRENEPHVAKSRTPTELAVAAAYQLCGNNRKVAEVQPPLFFALIERQLKNRLLPQWPSLTSADSVHHRGAETTYLESQAIRRVGDLHRPGDSRAVERKDEGRELWVNTTS